MLGLGDASFVGSVLLCLCVLRACFSCGHSRVVPSVKIVVMVRLSVLNLLLVKGAGSLSV